jgi:hypothetical protein
MCYSQNKNNSQINNRFPNRDYQEGQKMAFNLLCGPLAWVCVCAKHPVISTLRRKVLTRNSICMKTDQ